MGETWRGGHAKSGPRVMRGPLDSLCDLPIGKLEEQILLGGRHIGDGVPLGEHGPVFEADHREGWLLRQPGVELTGAQVPTLAVGGPIGLEQLGGLSVAVTSVVEGASGGDEGGEIKVGGKPHLPQVEVKVPALKGGDIGVPVQLGEGGLDAQIVEAVDQVLGRRKASTKINSSIKLSLTGADVD